MSSQQPPDQPARPGVTRRGFLNAIIIAIGAVIALVLAVPGIGYLIAPALGRKRPQPEWDPVAQESALQPSITPFKAVFTQQVQDAWVLANVQRTIWVTYQGPDRIQVLSARCTHLGCTVHWDAARNLFACPCHGGLYNAQGQVIGGPPPRPLHRLEAKLEGGKLLVRGDQYA